MLYCFSPTCMRISGLCSSSCPFFSCIYRDEDFLRVNADRRRVVLSPEYRTSSKWLQSPYCCLPCVLPIFLGVLQMLSPKVRVPSQNARGPPTYVCHLVQYIMLILRSLCM